MRYIPVVETETDDDGKPINIIPPWVVNEAGQDLGDKLDNDTIISVNKSMEIIDEILRKARSTGKLARDAKKKGFKPAKAGPRGTMVVPKRPYMQPKVEPAPVDPETDEEKKAIDKANGDPPQPSTGKREQTYVPPSGQTGPEMGPQPGPSVVDNMKRQFSQGAAAGAEAGAAKVGAGIGAVRGGAQELGRQAAAGGRAAVGRGAEAGKQVAGYGADLGRGAVAGGRQVMERGRERLGAGVQRMGELFGAGKKRLGEAGQAVKRGAIRADLAAGEAGRRVKAGAQEVGRRAAEGGRRVGAAGQEAGKRVRKAQEGTQGLNSY